MSHEISKYVTLFKNLDGEYCLFNAYGCLLLKVGERIYNLLKDNKINLLTIEEKDLLLEHKIIVERGEDHTYYLEEKFSFYAKSNSQEVLSLTLVPTSGCNFACPYCFEEDKNHSSMSERTLDNIITFIKDHKKAKFLNLTWYGGEPLMKFDIIQRFYKKLDSCISLSLQRQSLITNGYLLNSDKIDFFKRRGINHIQITLDGNKENHNKTRCLYPNKKGTFNRIINNIDNLLSLMPDCQVSIRVNINKKNVDDFCELYIELHSKWRGKNIYIYPGFIREDNYDKTQLSSTCITIADQIDFFLSLREKGIKVDLFPKNPIERGCMMNTINSYIIGASGELYKCWNDVSNPRKIIGYIDQKDFVNKGLFCQYMLECSQFDDLECRNCKVFPICQGGCGWYRYRNLYEKGSFNVCSIFKNTDKLKFALNTSFQDMESEYPTYHVK